MGGLTLPLYCMISKIAFFAYSSIFPSLVGSLLTPNIFFAGVSQQVLSEAFPPDFSPWLRCRFQIFFFAFNLRKIQDSSTYKEIFCLSHPEMSGFLFTNLYLLLLHHVLMSSPLPSDAFLVLSFSCTNTIKVNVTQNRF